MGKSSSGPSQVPSSGHLASFSETTFPSLPPSNTADPSSCSCQAVSTTLHLQAL